jgi:Fur family peroxide stress response transcriptional regulator
MQSRSVDMLSTELASQGLRATRQRVALLRLLRQSRHHPTVVELHEVLRKEQRRVSRKTVYEILDSFVRAGLASCPGEGATPARYEANREPHDHARCRKCGRLFDLPASRVRHGRSLRRALAGFRVESVSVMLRGVCARCA